MLEHSGGLGRPHGQTSGPGAQEGLPGAAHPATTPTGLSAPSASPGAVRGRTPSSVSVRTPLS